MQVQVLLQGRYRSQSQVLTEDFLDDSGALRVNHQLPVIEIVTQRHCATHPHALLLRGGDLVADPFSRNLPFELGEGQQDVER